MQLPHEADSAERLQRLATSYLDHIRIAVEARDQGAPFRDFVDNRNAFRVSHDHHRTRGDRPRWFNNPSAIARIQMLDALDFRSAGAAAILAVASDNPVDYQRRHQARDQDVRLVVDHVIPIRAMVAPLFAGEVELTREGIDAHLRRWYRLGLISRGEDLKLDAQNLRSAMPEGWDGVQLFARYDAVGIVAATG